MTFIVTISAFMLCTVVSIATISLSIVLLQVLILSLLWPLPFVDCFQMFLIYPHFLGQSCSLILSLSFSVLCAIVNCFKHLFLERIKIAANRMNLKLKA